MTPLPGYCFDVAVTLGIGTPSTQPLPAPIPGEIVLRIPDGLSLQALRDSPVGNRFMSYQYWYDKYKWSKRTQSVGPYRLRIPVPNSTLMVAAEQAAMLLADDETFAPVALVAAALLCIQVQGGADPLQKGSTRCAEHAATHFHVGLTWKNGHLAVGHCCEKLNLDNLWVSSVRTPPEPCLLSPRAC